MYRRQIPATKLPREIHFKSDKGEIEAFVCRDAQDEETRNAPLQSTEPSADCDPFKQGLADESGVIADFLEDDSFSKLLGSSSLVARNSSPKAKKHPLDLSPENFFMTSNEMNGKSNAGSAHPLIANSKLTELVTRALGLENSLCSSSKMQNR